MMPLFTKLQILFGLLQHSPRSSLAPTDILHLARPPGFQPGHQHDSSEFLGYLLDMLYEQERSVSGAVRIGDEHPHGTAENHPPVGTVAQHSFGGRAVTISRCGNCDTQSERADNFNCRSLAIAVTSPCKHSWITTYNQRSGDNQYHCDICRGLTDGERVTRVVEPPPRLVLTLKHFRYDPASQQHAKLLQHVKLDAHVHLDDAQYDLYAAVVHVGSSLDSGHYYTYVRDGQDWYKFNDFIVTRTIAEELCNVRPPETPYILFYSRQDCIDPEPLPITALSPFVEEALSKDSDDLDTERRRRPIRTYENRHKRNDEPPPTGCSGGSFLNPAGSRYVY